VQSQEQAADSRVERLAGRAEGRREAAEKAKEAVGARPIHITSQLGLAGSAAGGGCLRARRAPRAAHSQACRACPAHDAGVDMRPSTHASRPGVFSADRPM
jgi:hypothetical protein